MYVHGEMITTYEQVKHTRIAMINSENMRKNNCSRKNMCGILIKQNYEEEDH